MSIYFNGTRAAVKEAEAGHLIEGITEHDGENEECCKISKDLWLTETEDKYMNMHAFILWI